jgi:hypothetical protein
MDFDFQEAVKLIDMANLPVGEINQAPPQPTTRWWPGEVVSDTVSVPVDAGVLPPAVLQLDVGLVNVDTLRVLPVFNEDGQEVPRSVTRVKVLPPSWPDLAEVKRLAYVFNESMALAGARIEETSVAPGETLSLQLYWSALVPVNEDYTVFVHLLDGAGDLVAQGDGPPAGGRYPTSAWSPGEVVLDTHMLQVPNELASGRYTLVAGLYRVSDGTRLLARSWERSAMDGIVLGEIYVR